MSEREDWLREAVELSRRCPPSPTAYCVGAIVVDADGKELSRGYSRESPHVHAEQAALAKLGEASAERRRSRSLAEPSTANGAAVGATVYTSMEPCSERTSGRPDCTSLIIAAGITRVVFALREPPLFVQCHGIELLEQAGIEVVEVPDLADTVRDINRAVLGRQG